MANTQPSAIQTISGTLASIAGANTTGIELIAAPGSSKIIIVTYVFMNVKNGTTPWTGVGNAWLTYGNTGNDQVNMASALITNTIPGGTASTNYSVGVSCGIGTDWLGGSVYTSQRVSSTNSLNKAVCFTCSNAVTAGNGTIDWKIWYAVIASA